MSACPSPYVSVYVCVCVGGPGNGREYDSQQAESIARFRLFFFVLSQILPGRHVKIVSLIHTSVSVCFTHSTISSHDANSVLLTHELTDCARPQFPHSSKQTSVFSNACSILCKFNKTSINVNNFRKYQMSLHSIYTCTCSASCRPTYHRQV